MSSAQFNTTAITGTDNSQDLVKLTTMTEGIFEGIEQRILSLSSTVTSGSNDVDGIESIAMLTTLAQCSRAFMESYTTAMMQSLEDSNKGLIFVDISVVTLKLFDVVHTYLLQITMFRSQQP